jgi:DNA (cytosine-5)-methyltransferase 1
MMTIGSLFSGVGGLELGLEWAGFGPVLWQVEIDPFCRAVLAKHWPDAVRYEDVRTVGVATLAPVDLVCGGFPCQDISVAGKGAGLAGSRSGLWREFARIVKELRPRFVVIENVAALLGRGFGDVLRDLSSLGYDAEWSTLSAADVGAPHLRKRLFIVAYTVGDKLRDEQQRQPARPADGIRDEGQTVAGDDGAQGVVADSDGRGRCGERIEEHSDEQSASRDLPDRCGERRRGEGARTDWWQVEPDVGRVAHGVSDRVDRLRALGNAVVPQCAEVVGDVVKRILATKYEAA